jgi:hypothetical protein
VCKLIITQHNIHTKEHTMSKNHLPGNPHYENAKSLGVEDGGGIEATLALAFEQRTANLISVLVAGYSAVQIGGVDYTTLADQIIARLQPEGK